ncbi:hypothetical protein AKJ16_DCAP11715 [Drosera capensis]
MGILFPVRSRPSPGHSSPSPIAGNPFLASFSSSRSSSLLRASFSRKNSPQNGGSDGEGDAGNASRGDNSSDWDKAWSNFKKRGRKTLSSKFSLDKYVTWNPRPSNYPLSEEVDPIKRTERSNLYLWTSLTQGEPSNSDVLLKVGGASSRTIAASANQSIDAQFLAYTTGPEVSRLSGDTSEDIDTRHVPLTEYFFPVYRHITPLSGLTLGDRPNSDMQGEIKHVLLKGKSCYLSNSRSQPRPIRVDPYLMAFSTGPDIARMSVARSEDIRKMFSRPVDMEISRPKKKDGRQPPPKRGEIKVGIMRKLVKMIVSAGAKATELGKCTHRSVKG